MYMRLYIYIYILRGSAHKCVAMGRKKNCVYLQIRMRIYAYAYIYIYTHIHTHMYMCIHLP